MSRRGSCASPRRLGTENREGVTELLQPLNSADPHVRQATCQSFAQHPLRHDQRIVAALLTHLQDKDQYVRQAAASSLGQAGKRGDEHVVQSLVIACADPDPGVRRVACISVGQLSQRASSAAIAALLGRLEDKDGGVRRAAMKALEKVTEKSDAKVLSALFSRTSDGEAFVRHAAVEVLSRVAEEGNAEVVSRLLVLLDTDRDSRVRGAATEALGRLAVRGDSRVLTALLGRLDDEADGVRRAAATALGHVTFAPLQELEMQERHIAELEYRGAHEVATRDRTIQEMEAKHSLEVARLQRRIDELEERLRQDVGERDQRLVTCEAQLSEQEWLTRVSEFMPHATKVTQFLSTLPSMAAPSCYGTEIIAPVWALRCARGACAEPTSRRSMPRGSLKGNELEQDGKDKRWLLSLFELFEQLSTGRVTSMDLTDTRPLDVYVHRGEDCSWGLYCCSRHRLLALLMRQACVRNELLTVKCILRPKHDQSYWGWQWANFYDGGDGLAVNPSSGKAAIGSSPRSETCSPTSSRMSLGMASGIRASSSGPSTPRFFDISGRGRGGGGGGLTGVHGASGQRTVEGNCSEPESPRSSKPSAEERDQRAGSGCRRGSQGVSNRRAASKARCSQSAVTGCQSFSLPGHARQESPQNPASGANMSTAYSEPVDNKTVSEATCQSAVPTITMELIGGMLVKT